MMYVLLDIMKWTLAFLIIVTIGLGVLIFFQIKTYLKINRVAEIYESQPHFVYEDDM